MKPKLYWHFLPSDKCLANGDGRKVVRGRWYKRQDTSSPLALCSNGMHACERAIDALRYAPGPIVTLCELRGDILADKDKVAADERKVVAMADATRVLHLFAIDCAERALKDVHVTDERSWNALKVKRRWLDKLATDQDLAAAWGAARDAAWAAARDAAWYAAMAAAMAAARDAAMAAAWGAARDAAWYAAIQQLEIMVIDEAKRLGVWVEEDAT